VLAAVDMEEVGSEAGESEGSGAETAAAALASTSALAAALGLNHAEAVAMADEVRRDLPSEICRDLPSAAGSSRAGAPPPASPRNSQSRNSQSRNGSSRVGAPGYAAPTDQTPRSLRSSAEGSRGGAPSAAARGEGSGLEGSGLEGSGGGVGGSFKRGARMSKEGGEGRGVRRGSTTARHLTIHTGRVRSLEHAFEVADQLATSRASQLCRVLLGRVALMKEAMDAAIMKEANDNGLAAANLPPPSLVPAAPPPRGAALPAPPSSTHIPSTLIDHFPTMALSEEEPLSGGQEFPPRVGTPHTALLSYKSSRAAVVETRRVSSGVASLKMSPAKAARLQSPTEPELSRAVLKKRSAEAEKKRAKQLEAMAAR